jgi:hypothetical protein
MVGNEADRRTERKMAKTPRAPKKEAKLTKKEERDIEVRCEVAERFYELEAAIHNLGLLSGVKKTPNIDELTAELTNKLIAAARAFCAEEIVNGAHTWYEPDVGVCVNVNPPWKNPKAQVQSWWRKS